MRTSPVIFSISKFVSFLCDVFLPILTLYSVISKAIIEMNLNCVQFLAHVFTDTSPQIFFFVASMSVFIV
jgi:hypothetical protein